MILIVNLLSYNIYQFIIHFCTRKFESMKFHFFSHISLSQFLKIQLRAMFFALSDQIIISNSLSKSLFHFLISI